MNRSVLLVKKVTPILPPDLEQSGGSPRRRRHLTASDHAEGSGRPVGEGTMRSLGVVVDAIQLDFRARTSKRRKAILREALVAEAAIETLDVRVLRRLAGLNEVELHTVLRGPGFQLGRDEFGSVVDAQRLRKTVRPHERVEHAHDACGGQRGVDLDRVALAGIRVDDVERAERAAVRECSVTRSRAA
jgi:hypothetical protein